MKKKIPWMRGKSLKERFHLQHQKDLDTECWEWIGYKNNSGYGQIKDNYKTKMAHRVSYEMHVGNIPEGLYVCHRCDNPSCVNPDHLYAGTAKQNRKDAVDRNRLNPRFGEGHHKTKLTEQQVMEIFNSHLKGSELSELYGISRTSVTNIKKGDRWGWLTGANRRQGNV